MRAGRLRHWITIQNPEKTQNEVGETMRVWIDLARVPAAVEPVSGKEYFGAKQTLSEVTHRIKVRYLAGISTRSRILFNGREFDIQSVINHDERNRELDIMATETLS